jgi:hypothetical protein
MNWFLISWFITSVLAYIMLYITERKMSKGFTPFDAWMGFIMCFFIPYGFFLLFSAGLILSLKDRNKVKIKHPAITREDMELYQKQKREEKQAI